MTAPLASRAGMPCSRRSDRRALDALRAGERARVHSVRTEDAQALEDVGLRAGVDFVVERRLPLGGPVILDLGSARIAVARAIAARVITSTPVDMT